MRARRLRGVVQLWCMLQFSGLMSRRRKRKRDRYVSGHERTGNGYTTAIWRATYRSKGEGVVVLSMASLSMIPDPRLGTSYRPPTNPGEPKRAE
jgi:hypothetical protein